MPQRYLAFRCFIAVALLVLFRTDHAAHGAMAYTVELLGNLGTNASGSTHNQAQGINSPGDAVGYSQKWSGNNSLGTRAVRWAAGQTAATELGNLGTNGSGSTDSTAFGINASGTAAGYAMVWSGNASVANAVRWAAGQTTATALGNLQAGSGSHAFAINTTGDIVGSASMAPGGTRPVRWAAGQNGATELGNIGLSAFTATQSEAVAIDSAGDAAGWGDKWVNGTNTLLGARAVRWAAGQTAATELGNLGTNSSGVTVSQALALDGFADAGGYAELWSGNTDLGRRPVLWAAGQTSPLELGDLGTDASGHTDGSVAALDSAGDAVGYALAGGLNGRATLWLAGTTSAIDLNDLIDPASGWTLLDATGINDSGQIVGYGYYNAESLAFRLTPITPEPALLAPLFLAALALLRTRRPAKSRGT